VPAEARWSHLQASAKQPTIGKTVDDAMVAIERDNPRLKGVLPKDYARPGLDKQRLGELIDVIATIALTAASEGEQTHRSVDLLGRVYEYFLTRFASAEGKNGGQFYTPSCVVRCLVEMLAPYKGRIYDPCCGSGGMFVQSEKFVESHGGKIGDISIYGQESNATTRRLAIMNLALRGIEADFGPEHADTFRRDLHPDLRADYVLANPPFNDSDWFRKDDDVRWQFGVPPKGNANFAWVQHFIHHLAPQGMAGFVLANGSMSSNQSGEGDIRRALIEADLVDCMVALPGQLFYSTQIPVCLWFLAKNKGARKVKRGDAGSATAAKADPLHRRAQNGHPHRPRAPRADRRRPRERSSAPTTNGALMTSPGAARRGKPDTPCLPNPARTTRTSPASANPPPPPKSPRTATSSRPAATSAPRKSKTTATLRGKDAAPRRRTARPVRRVH
jgi:type I restriction enzyme M protein